MNATGKNAMLSSSADITLDLSSLFVYMFIISDWIFWYVTFCVFFIQYFFYVQCFCIQINLLTDVSLIRYADFDIFVYIFSIFVY